MQSASSIEESKSVKKTPAKRAKASKRSKDSDKVQEAEQSSIAELAESSDYGLQDDESQCGEDQTFGQGELKDVNEYLKGKVGVDINAKKWLEGCEGLDDLEKSEVIIRLVYEVCLAKNIEYDLENDAAENEKDNNKDRNFDTRRIFEILKKVNRLLLPQDRRRFVEFVCQKGNVKLLEVICRQENKVGGGKAKVNQQYSWQGEFTGYERLTDLLQYVLNQECSPEIVLCIAKKVYGSAHIFYNGEQYLDDIQVTRIKRNFNYPDSVIKDCLKAAIELGYKDAVSVMLGGDVYHCIRLMKDERFQEEKRFSEALKVIKETVAEVMSSWVNDKRQSFKDDVQRLLKEGIEIDIEKMDRKDLIAELGDREIKLSDKNKKSKERLVEMLKGEGGGKVRLSKTVVGGLISALFFHYQKELTEKPFEPGISRPDKSRREKEINELNKREKNEKKKIDSKSFVKEKVLEKIKLLNSSSHAFNSWFFREVLAAIVNDEEKLGELKAVCTAICKEKVEELLRGAEVHEDVVDALKFFGVEHNQVTTRKKGCSGCNTAPKFGEDIENLIKGIRELNDPSLMADEVLEIAEGLASGKVPAFSGLSRRTIIKLKNKKDKTDDEANDLKEKVLKIVDEIKRGVDILAKGVNGGYHIDIEDVFRHFKIINSEIEEKDKREFVVLVCQKGNVKLLEMICQQEKKDGGGKTQVNQQYPWKGEFTGYERLIDLLQYVLKKECSPEIVLCIAKKVYGGAHIVYNGEQYLQVASTKRKFDYPDSVIKDCLKAAIELGYKDVVPVMLGGDIYQCIRLMKGEKFQEGKEALDMVEETVEEVMSSWVRDERQSFKDDVQRLLKEGIEIDIEKMGKQELIDELESLGIKLFDKDKRSKERLVKILKEEGGGKVRLGKTVVGGLISTLFFNYQDELIKDKGPFELKISFQDKNKREKEINELKEKIGSESFKNFIKEKVLEKIKLLNKSSHISNNWFFREVLSAIVNGEEKFNKLKAVCAAIYKGPMEKLLKGAEVHEDVVDVLKFFGVDTSKRDLGTVSGQDIVNIAKCFYGWMEPINGKYLEEKVFFTCTDVPSLEDKLKHYKKIQQKDLIFTSIINTGKEHWVTLVVAHSVKDENFSAYYCDSFGKGLSKKMSDVLKKALEIDANRISSSLIKQQEDEYNCGIFALANAYKITRIIKDKSFTEINVELKGKLDAGQLRKEFAKKVEEMWQKSGEANSEYEEHGSEAMQVEDALSRVPLDSKAAKKKNEEVMQNSYGQNQNVCHNREKVHIVAPSGNIFNEGKMVGKKRNWDESEDIVNELVIETEGIDYVAPEFAEFIEMFDRDYRDKLLKYEFDYERLELLYPSSVLNDASNVKADGRKGSVSKDYKKTKDIFLTYRQAIKFLISGEEEKAVPKLEDLASKSQMPHAKYALAIVRFKNLSKNGAPKCGKDEKSDSLVFQVIEWLCDKNLEIDFLPLNWSLLLKVQLYDIGGYGRKVKEITGLDVNRLLDRVLRATKNTTIKFDNELVEERMLLEPGKLIIKSEQRKSDSEFLIRCAMYEFLKQKMLQGDLSGEDLTMISTFRIISEISYKGGSKSTDIIFKYVRAEMIFGHATYLLMHNIGEDKGKKQAVGLLDEACTLEHPGALYLRGVLLCDREDFWFVSNDSARFNERFDGLKLFAKRFKNDTAASMAANECIRKNSFVRQLDTEEGERMAEEILRECGFSSIWEDWKAKQQDSRVTKKRRSGASGFSPPALPPGSPALVDDIKQSQVHEPMVLGDISGDRVIDNGSASSKPDATENINLHKVFSTGRDKKLCGLRNLGSTIEENVKQGKGGNLCDTPKSSKSMTSHNVSLIQQSPGIEPTSDSDLLASRNPPMGYVVPYVNQEKESSLLVVPSDTSLDDQTAKNMNKSMPKLEGKEDAILNCFDPIKTLAPVQHEHTTEQDMLNLSFQFNANSSTPPVLPTGSSAGNDLLHTPKSSKGTFFSDMSNNTPLPTQTAFIWDSLDPGNKHFGVFLSPARSRVKRLSNSYNNTVDCDVSSGIGVILSCRNKGKAEPDVLDLSVRESGCSHFQDNLNKAIDFCKKREYDKAFEVYQGILLKRKDVSIMGNIDFELACYNGAVVLYAQGKYDSALKAFQTAADDRDCEWASVARYNVAVVLCKQGKYNDALGILQGMQGSEHGISSIESDIRVLKRQISKSSDNPSTDMHSVGLECMDTSMSPH